MRSKILSGIPFVFFLLLTGCAAPAKKMAFSDDAGATQRTGKPLFLMTVTLRNSYRTSYQPRLADVYVEKKIAATGKVENIRFEIDDKARNETNLPSEGNTYFLRMELDPGDYVIRAMFSKSSSFMVLGWFKTPLNIKMAAPGKGVFYLGRVNATVRERQGDEFRAGTMVPLIDQAVVGASTGTFDVDISDNWQKDGPAFLAKFPALQNADIQSTILPPFDRPLAQRLWEMIDRMQDRLRLGRLSSLDRSPKDAPKSDAAGLIDIEKQTVKDNTYKATNFAKLSDVDAVPKLGPIGKEGYRKWLGQKYPRAFVIAEDGAWVATWNIYPADPSESKDPLVRAIQRCQKHGHKDCRPYAINGRVVWIGAKEVVVNAPAED